MNTKDQPASASTATAAVACMLRNGNMTEEHARETLRDLAADVSAGCPGYIDVNGAHIGYDVPAGAYVITERA